MAKDYELGNPADMRRFQRDLEKATDDIVKATVGGIREDARIRCAIHGQFTEVRETDPQTGSFEISGCCDDAVERAYAAASRHFD
jgi:hypothetical protein